MYKDSNISVCNVLNCGCFQMQESFFLLCVDLSSSDSSDDSAQCSEATASVFFCGSSAERQETGEREGGRHAAKCCGLGVKPVIAAGGL